MTTVAKHNSETGTPPRSLPVGAQFAGAAIVAAVFFWFFPLFRVVPLSDTQQQMETAGFSAEEFVAKFWTGPLQEAAAAAVELTELRQALQADRDAAVATHGHRLGMSGTAAFLVRGEGRIATLSPDTVGIALADDEAVGIVIEIGPVFGNAIRDGSGRLDVSDFSNTREFNDISSIINLRVETEVLPMLQDQAQVEARVQFAGGIELADYDDLTDPLKLVPLSLSFP